MDSTRLLPSCLHGGPVPLAQCQDPAAIPAYIETITDIPRGSMARILQEQCARYGLCGFLAVDNGMVVGKIRAYPQAVVDRVPFLCVQQEQPARELLALQIGELPAEREVLHLECIQVAREYWGRGIAGGMLTAIITWARRGGWRQLRARAVSHIPPVLAWCGQLSHDALERRGFSVLHRAVSADLREGVASQRAGHHGEGVRRQWEAFAHLSDEEAALMFEMALDLEDNGWMDEGMPAT